MSEQENDHDHEDTPVADHTPDTPKVTEPEKKTEDDSSLRDTVARLESTVNALSDQVQGLTEPKTEDTKPVKPPWHKRKWGSQ